MYSDGYHADKLKKIAVNRNNVLQCEYTRIHYPDAEILEYDGTDQCIRAIKRGEAGCTLVEALRAVRLLGEDKSLEMLPLTDTCGFCFGVSYGDTGLPRVLSHGLSILGDDYGISHAAQRHSRPWRNQPENRRPGNPPRKPVQDTGRGGASARHLE